MAMSPPSSEELGNAVPPGSSGRSSHGLPPHRPDRHTHENRPLVSERPAMTANTRRLRFGLRTALGAVAIFAATFALLDAWLLAPYRAEQHAADALMRLGSKVVLVDHAPRWLRGYVGEDVLNMRVAASIDLSYSRVTDADLVHLLAFRHFGQLNLSDTAVSDAGLAHLRKVVAYRF